MPTIKPTIGRVVWAYITDMNRGRIGPLAGVISFVHSEQMVNLMVIGEDGTPTPKTSVQLVQEGNEAPMGDYCTWMPYQLGQAAKTEQAEKMAAAAKRGARGMMSPEG